MSKSLTWITLFGNFIITHGRFNKRSWQPYTKEDILGRLRYPMSQRKFKLAWSEITKHCLKKVNYNDKITWVINPAVAMRGKYIKPWLYEEFKEYLDPNLNASTIRKFETLVKTMHEEENMREAVYRLPII